MKNALFFSFLVFISINTRSQTIYSKAFGNSQDTPLIYLHGGPGYNSSVFEITTAEKLAKQGFYVIVYDRRGEGRSMDKNASYTFEETFKDLELIYYQYHIQKATLLGHSFGGILATLYAEKNKEKVDKVILIGTPITIQETFTTIIQSSELIYKENNDQLNLKYIEMLKKMDSYSLEYSSYCFTHALQNGFYTPKTFTKEAISLYGMFKKDSTLLKYASKMSFEAPQGFWKNEQYTSIDLSLSIQKIKTEIPFYGIYGVDDGLFSAEQLLNTKTLVGKDHFSLLKNCSHNVFVDQQTLFMNSLKKWIK